MFTLLFFTVAGLYFAIAAPNQAVDIHGSCQETTKASDEAVRKLHHLEDLDDSNEGKCFVYCSMTTFGVIKKDGSVDNEYSKGFIREQFEGVPEKLEQVWRTCQEKVAIEEDLCQYAYTLMQCFITDAGKENLKRKGL